MYKYSTNNSYYNAHNPNYLHNIINVNSLKIARFLEYLSLSAYLHAYLGKISIWNPMDKENNLKSLFVMILLLLFEFINL